jgi:hypothetical protein
MSDEYEADFEDDVRSSQLLTQLSRHAPLSLHHTQRGSGAITGIGIGSASSTSGVASSTLPLPPLLPSDEPFNLPTATAIANDTTPVEAVTRTPNVRQSRDMLSVLDLAQTPVTGNCPSVSNALFFFNMLCCLCACYR